ncbi:MAG: hypothetical protein HQL66_00695 [Magnetococcales bacterium]|nr:hypothetical protein [Magnetococcales bacterium]
MSGLEGEWIPVFRGGKQTDAQGVAHDGDALIDQAVKSFDPARHEPPVTIGHPADNAPAWGWVSDLRRQGDLLEARFRDVQPEFAALVRARRFAKRSASFYPDGRLRHVAFLGAAPPAVKGLPDMQFADTGAAFDFADNEIVANEQDDATGEQKEMTGIDEQEMQRRIAAAKAEERQAAEKEFAERQDILEQSRRRKDGIRTFVEELKQKGIVTPAMEKMGLCAFMEALEGGDASINFADGGKKSLGDCFREFLSALPVQVPVGAYAPAVFAEADMSERARQYHLGMQIAGVRQPSAVKGGEA